MATPSEYAYNPGHFLAVSAKLCLFNHGDIVQ